MELNGGDPAAGPARPTRRDWLRAAVWGGGLAAAWPAAGGCGPSTRSGATLAGEIVGANDRVGHWLRDGSLDEQLERTASIEWRDVDVAIVGGGVAGLAAAYRLVRAGCRDFVVLELEDEPGGTARSGSRDGFSFPWGAHYLPLPRPDNTPLVELLEDMGVVLGRDRAGQLVVDEQALCRDPQERLLFQGEWHEDLDPWDGADADERRQYEAFRQEIARWTHWRDPQGRRAFTLPSSRCSDDPTPLALDQLTMAQWLEQHGWRSPRLRWLVDYACRDDYGMSVDEVSAWAGLFYFCARQPEGDTARASNTAEARATSLARDAAAVGEDAADNALRMTAIRSSDRAADTADTDHPPAVAIGAQPLLTWSEGNGRLVRHLREVAGDRVHSNCPVLRIRPATSSQASGTPAADERLEVIAANLVRANRGPAASSAAAGSPAAGSPAASSPAAGGPAAGSAAASSPGSGGLEASEPPGLPLRGWRARRVICAVPQFVARRLIVGLPSDRVRAVDAFHYGAWMVANVHLRDRPRDLGFPMAWDNVDYRSDSLGYVVATHQQGVDHGPTVWTWYYAFTHADPRADRRKLYSLSWAEAAEWVLADLERAHPEIRHLATRVDVMRWGHAMIRPYPGFRASAARRLAAVPLGNIHFAHSELSGLALFEEAFDQACRAADEVLDQLGRQR